MCSLAFPAQSLVAVALAALMASPAIAETAPNPPLVEAPPSDPLLSAPRPTGPAMTADEFDAYVTGKVLTYSKYDWIYGTEEYLPGRRVRWQVTGDLCQYGHWYEKSGLICFTYEYAQGEHCWTFWQEDGLLRALTTDDLAGEPLSEVKDAEVGLNCPDLDVGV
ncbi:hypothetical protein Q9295_05610 [Xinfangfangia sp. CPCC 101601]|uniref:Uncharacterized protein n=1 Tax=Pseudogemmobacter lacusdianii TaxID=3069608 RepID=A0ABU0VVW7_9RHOB|nr:hypothetical protein [Xinfangfangia sp. CPCC 101601]MDQ2065838.1 hypothetical protein [Xinfangfangia sp. CPCC 101601]